MGGPEQKPDAPDAVASANSRWRVQLVWLVPIVAVLISGWLAVKAVIEQGPTITISFKTGEGLEAGKTKIKFKNVDIGVVKSVVLSADQKRVLATADIARDATSLLVDNTRFWVVRPRISGGTISGLNTLLSGSFIGTDVGDAQAPRRDFTGLEAPPVFTSDEPGRAFVLKGTDLGSIDVGTPVYFRRLQVGQIVSYSLDSDGKGVTVRAFVNAPYDRFVNADSRFWHASGIDVALDPTGVRVETQSLVSIMVGGIAFETPGEPLEQAAAPTGMQFTLYHDRAEAMKRHDTIVEKFLVNFTDSVRGLSVGASVDFRGVMVGEVTGIYTRFDRETRKFSISVEINLYPERFTSRYRTGAKGGRLSEHPKQLANALVEHGLRAQLRTGNLLTGQLYVALDFFPGASKATINWAADPPEMPTTPGALQSLQDSVTHLVAKLNGVPLDAIGKNVQQTLASADLLLKQLDSQVMPQARDTLASARTALDSANGALQPGSELQQNTGDAMREIARTAAAFRTLADYLERHPEALVRGKTERRP
ncbi:mammalian cell entry protein [Burkholderia ubonensis]|uniref:PqiB family protein n=1 Tax=Burkholderia ubonensis TaxID=101571 RepID=UPI000757C900|nr:MlaD family protein [Burkholderia ubonensis]KVZ78700.1 mammalian cell entry protein [Burkholderia ubonensis]